MTLRFVTPKRPARLLAALLVLSLPAQVHAQSVMDRLKTHADLNLSIEGHTDNVGSAPSNQAMSEKRAAAVRRFLVTNYQIDAARLTSKGLGATNPAASNNTTEGRQQNRRVELVKQ
jgi:outer membrane protein OmpA-like peptidoglycan-associated protein